MLIMNALQAWVKTGCFIGWIALLTACGGSSKKAEPDTTPNAFSFAAVTNAEPGATLTSAPVTIAGINADAPISITGGAYAINGATATSTPGTITNGQSVVISLAAAETTHTTTSATLTIGGVSGVFTITTLADTTPDAFSFDAITDVEPGSVQTSNTITVTGIDIAVPISITGGEYAIGEGEYTREAGTVANDQAVTLRVTAAAGTEQTIDAVLTIGSVTGTYSVTTFPDTQAPTAEILFPPLVSMTEGTTLLVRGKVADDFNAVEMAQIRVNEGTVQDLVLTENEDGSASWQVEVTLEAGENTLIVSAKDAAGNTAANAAQVNVRQDEELGSFPDVENPIAAPTAIVIDRGNNRNRLLVAQGGEGQYKLFNVDLTTGVRSLFKDFTGLGLTYLTDLLLHESNNQLIARDDAGRIATIDLDDPSQFNIYTLPEIGDGWVFTFDDSNSPATIMATNRNNGNLVRVSLDFTATEIFSDNSDPEQGPTMTHSRGIVFDKANQRYLLTALLDYTIYAVDSNTGVRSVFSKNGLNNGPEFGTEPNIFLYQLKIDAERNRVLVAESTSGRMFAIDLTTGDRSILSSKTSPNSLNPMDRPRSLAINSPDSYIFITDIRDHSIFAVDIVTGHRVYFSKN